MKNLQRKNSQVNKPFKLSSEDLSLEETSQVNTPIKLSSEELLKELLSSEKHLKCRNP